LDNLAKCVTRAGLEVEEVIASPLASGLTVVSEAERALGVVCIDLGGGATHLAIFADGSIAHSGALPVGGNHLTHDLSVGLRLTRDQAEQLKRKSGCALVAELPGEEEYLEIRPVGEEEPR